MLSFLPLGYQQVPGLEDVFRECFTPRTTLQERGMAASVELQPGSDEFEQHLQDAVNKNRYVHTKLLLLLESIWLFH